MKKQKRIEVIQKPNGQAQGNYHHNDDGADGNVDPSDGSNNRRDPQSNDNAN